MGLFGKEKITMTLEKYDYTPGDTINGTVKLQLKKPTKARKLEVAFIGMRVDRQTSMAVGPMVAGGGRRGRHGSQTQHTTIYDFTLPLDGEKEYQDDEYPFSIKIPEDIKQAEQKLEGKVGTAVTALKALSGVHSRIDWYVKAQLDVPMGLDVKKTQKIVLS